MMDRQSMPVRLTPAPASASGPSKLSTALSRALPHRIRHLRPRRGNVSFAGFPTPPEQVHAREPSNTICISPEQHATVCATRKTIPRSASCASSTVSTAASVESVASYSPRYSSSSLVLSTPLPQNLRVESWMYWARPDEALLASGVRRRRSDPANGECFTKVFGVLRNEFLLLYKSDHNSALFSSAAETPLVQIAVTRATLLTSRSFLVEDPHGHELELYLFERHDDATLERWEEAFEQAAELTESHFHSFDVKVDQLSRTSMYRGSLHDLHQQRPSFRQSFKHKMTRLATFGRFSASSSQDIEGGIFI